MDISSNNTDINNIILNIIQSPVDDRDWIFDISLSGKKNNIVDLRDDLMEIRNQGSQGTCYAQAAACMKELQEKKDYGLNEYLSPQFFYNNRGNLYDENEENDSGMFGRNVMKLLKEIGICTEKLYPYGIIENKDKISEDIYLNASRNKIKGYARVTTIDGLKESLNENGICLIAFPVYNYGKEIWNQSENDTFKGGHAMAVVGYLEDCFIIRNSWGSSWCDNGYCYYKFNDWGAHWEIWTTIDILEPDSPIPEPVTPEPPTPEPIPTKTTWLDCILILRKLLRK